MKALAFALVVIALIAADFLADAGIVHMSKHAHDGWSGVASVALLAFGVWIYVTEVYDED